MAGRPLAQARAQAALEAIRAASETPTEPRSEPIDYSPDLCAEAIQLADIGMLGAELAGHWAISEETLKEWEEAHPDLKAALQRARTRAKAWWQRQPRIAIREKDNKFPAGAWSQQVRALFPEYDDKSGVTINLDLGQLVVIQRREPTDDRLPLPPKPMIERQTPQLGHGWEVSGSTDSNLSDTGSAD